MFYKNLFKTACLGVFLLGLVACSGTSSDVSGTNPDVIGASPISTDATGVVTLNWMPPTENTDGSVLTDLSGYKIYYGLSSDSMTQSITISNPGLTEYVIENLSVDSTYYFTITTLNSQNIESDYSNIASKYVTS